MNGPRAVAVTVRQWVKLTAAVCTLVPVLVVAPGLVAALGAPGTTPVDRIVSFHLGLLLTVALVLLLGCSLVGAVVIGVQRLLAARNPGG